MTFGDLRENSDKFCIYFRMNVYSFDEFEGKISDKVKYRDTWMRQMCIRDRCKEKLAEMETWGMLTVL